MINFIKHKKYELYFVDMPGFNDSDKDYSMENDISTSLNI